MRGSKKQSAREPRTVEILFNGLFYFSFPDGRDSRRPDKRAFGTVGLLSTRPDHLPCITYGRGTGPSQRIILPFPAARSMPRVIEVHKTGEDGVIIKGATRETGWGKPRDRNDSTHNPNDFNWIIDFEGEELHDENLGENPGTLRPKLKFLTGEFRTNDISENKYFILHRGIIKPFGKVAKTMGVTISLVGNQKLWLQMGDARQELPEDLTNITLDNLPEHEMHNLLLERAIAEESRMRHKLKRQDMAAHHVEPTTAPSVDMAHPDHSQIYYDDLLDLDQSERFHFIPELPVGITKRNVPFICFGGGGSSNR